MGSSPHLPPQAPSQLSPPPEACALDFQSCMVDAPQREAEVHVPAGMMKDSCPQAPSFPTSCTCACTHTCTHAQTHMHTHTHTWIHIQFSRSISSSVLLFWRSRKSMCSHTCTYVHRSKCVHMHVHVCMRVQEWTLGTALAFEEAPRPDQYLPWPVVSHPQVVITVPPT